MNWNMPGPSRAWFAQAIENLEAAKPKAIGLDITFLERSVFGPEDDETLAATLKIRQHRPGGLLRPRTARQGLCGDRGRRLRDAAAAQAPHRAVQDTPSGAANTFRDPDGVVRAHLWFDFRRTERVETLAGQLYEVATRGGCVSAAQWAEMLINYRGPQETFDTIGFHQITARVSWTRTCSPARSSSSAPVAYCSRTYTTPLRAASTRCRRGDPGNILDNLLQGRSHPRRRQADPVLLSIRCRRSHLCGGAFRPSALL
jgi:hypothetical protein